MAAVTSTIFSHNQVSWVLLVRRICENDSWTSLFMCMQVAKKNMLVTMLIDHLWSNEPGLTDELATTLNELTSLNRAEHSRVALRARQVPHRFCSPYHHFRVAHFFFIVWVCFSRFWLPPTSRLTSCGTIRWNRFSCLPSTCMVTTSIRRTYRNSFSRKLQSSTFCMTSFTTRIEPCVTPP